MNARTDTHVRSNAASSIAFAGGRAGVGTVLAALALLATPAVAAPQIEIRVNNQIIANNQEVEFEDTALGATTPLIVVIRNIGNEDLVFTGTPFVSVAGGFDTYFSVIQPPLETGNKLSPNGSTAFRVDFAPEHVADRLDSKVFIFTNANPTVFGLPLAGRSVGPRMVVKQDDVTIADAGVVFFPDTPIGKTSTVELVIENIGSAALLLTDAVPASLGGGDAAAFAIAQQPDSTIAAGASTTLKLTFSPTTATATTTGLFIAHNEQSIFHDGLYGASVEARGLPAVVVDEEEIIEENENVNDNANDNNNDEPVNHDVADDELGNTNENKNDDAGQEFDDDIATQVGNPCGFGIGFAVPACMLGLCTARSRTRRSVSPR